MNYQRGQSLGYRVRDLLEGRGYFVTISAGSKGLADLVGLRVDAKLMVQAKQGKKQISKKEWDALLAEATRVGAVPVLATAVHRGPVKLFRILAPRIPRARVQPMEPFEP